MNKRRKSDVESIKQQLNLQPHPSGSGVFREVWRSDRKVTFSEQAEQQIAAHGTGTSVYFLLEAPNVVKWHRNVVSDAVYCWSTGDKVKFHLLNKDGDYTTRILGDVVTYPECSPQLVIPHGTWYAIELAGSTGFCLFCAIVIPGFEYEDWRLGKDEDIVKKFPRHAELIKHLL